MKYVDKEGKEIEISYSTEVMKKLEDTLQKNIFWRKKLYTILARFQYFAIVAFIVLVWLIIYLDKRDAVSIIARRIFCPGYS